MYGAQKADPAHGDAWDAYLDILEALVEMLEQALAAEELPVWRAPEPPAVPAPDRTLGRRDTLLARMMIAVRTIEQRMDDIRTELQSLPTNRPRPASATAITLGARCDISG